MTIIKHKFQTHQIDPATEILILGTFSPETPKNDAEFFYGRIRNFLWRLLPLTFGDEDLKGKPVQDKLDFIRNRKIDFVDLIEEVEVEPGHEADYDDHYIDSRVSKWVDVTAEIQKLTNLKRVYFTRKTLADIPNMKQKVETIQHHCVANGIGFILLKTPARTYSSVKQAEWTALFANHN